MQSIQNQKGRLLNLLIFLLLTSLGTIIFLIQENSLLKEKMTKYAVKCINKETAKVTPYPTAIGGIVADSSENLKIYTNYDHRVSFQFPSRWTLTEMKGDPGDDYNQNIKNTKVMLANKEAVITLYLNLYGIGGRGMNYQGKPYMLNKNKLYEFYRDDFSPNQRQIGITDSLTNSLGVFQINGITYSIYLTYPLTYDKKQADDVARDLHLLLSTISFPDK